jgi:hypothetical protein
MNDKCKHEMVEGTFVTNIGHVTACTFCEVEALRERVKALESDLDAKHARLVKVADKLANEHSNFFRAQSAVHQYMVALGPHLSDSWREFLAKECGLEIDESSPYRHPKPPKKPITKEPK